MSCRKNKNSEWTKCSNNSHCKSIKLQKCKEELKAYLSADLGEEFAFNLIEGNEILGAPLKFHQINVKKNMDTQEFVNPPYTGFVVQHDGIYRISYSIQCFCSGVRIVAGVVKNGLGTGIPGSISIKFFHPTPLEQEDTVDKSFIAPLKRGDILTLEYSAFNFITANNIVIFEDNTNISINTI